MFEWHDTNLEADCGLVKLDCHIIACTQDAMQMTHVNSMTHKTTYFRIALQSCAHLDPVSFTQAGPAQQIDVVSVC